MARNPASITAGGQYVPPGVYTAAQLGLTVATQPVVLYVEGITTTETGNVDARSLQVALDPDGGGILGFGRADRVLVSVLGVDLDLDSDNTNGVEPPDGSPEEDTAENIPGTPGKLLCVNDGDDNENEVPDFADGMVGLAVNADEHFFPVHLQVPEWVAIDTVQVRITYDASNPANVVRVPSVTGDAPELYQAAPGKLRLWRHNGNVLRNPADILAGGDYVPPGTCAATDLGFSDQVRDVSLFLEGIQASQQPGDLLLTVDVDIYCLLI